MIKLIYIQYLSMILWFLPPFKQFGTKYFWFFVLMAISDPLAILIIKFTDITAIQFFLFILALQFSSLMNERRIKYITIFSAFITTLFVTLIHSFRIIHLIGAGYLIAILMVLIIEQNYFFSKKSLNIFLSLLILNTLINILKFTSFALSSTWGVNTFYIGVAIQLVFGLLFTFININTKLKAKV